MADLGAHAALLLAELASPFSGLLGSHKRLRGSKWLLIVRRVLAADRLRVRGFAGAVDPDRPAPWGQDSPEV
jgi:hypothetical protein